MNKLIIAFLVSINLLLNTIPVYAGLQKEYSSVEEFIAEQKIIRVAIDTTPGFGNQASSINVMNYLRKLGFTGTFEVIYTRNTKDKVIILFNLPTTISDDFFDAKHNIRFIQVGKHIARLQTHMLARVPLGINGGEFAGEELFSCYSQEAQEMHVNPSEAMCRSVANFANVEAFADMNPFPKRASYLSLYDKQDSFKLDESKNKFFIMPVSDLKQAKLYLENDPRGQILLQQKPALKSLIEGMERHTLTIFPLYGYSLLLAIDGKKGGYFPSNILQILTAARFAQLQTKAFQTPLIIPIFYNYEKEMAILKDILHRDNWGQYEKPGAAVERKVIKSLGLADSLQFASLSDSDAINKIEMLKPGQILLLSIGSLPKTVFDGIYTYSDLNVWPQIREGATSFNSLILTGRPHFRCTDYYMKNRPSWEIGYDDVSDPKFKQNLEKFYKLFCAADDRIWLKHEDTYQQLAQFILESANPNSPISLYFSALKTKAVKPENDKIHYVLEEMLKAIKTN